MTKISPNVFFSIFRVTYYYFSSDCTSFIPVITNISHESFFDSCCSCTDKNLVCQQVSKLLWRVGATEIKCYTLTSEFFCYHFTVVVNQEPQWPAHGLTLFFSIWQVSTFSMLCCIITLLHTVAVVIHNPSLIPNNFVTSKFFYMKKYLCSKSGGMVWSQQLNLMGTFGKLVCSKKSIYGRCLLGSNCDLMRMTTCFIWVNIIRLIQE